MKIVRQTRLNVVNENGNLASHGKYERHSVSSNGIKNQGIKIAYETQRVENSKQRCVFADRTNSKCNDNKKSAVFPSVSRSCDLKETITQKSSSYLKKVPLNNQNGLFSKSLLSNESLKNCSMKKSENSGARNLGPEIGQRKNTVDVYEFLLDDDDDIDSENKCKAQKVKKIKKLKSNKCRKKRKLISVPDSPDEIMPAKKVRKPLQERTQENSLSKTNSKLESKAVQSPSAGTPHSNSWAQNRVPAKTVHFNIPSCERLEPSPYAENSTSSTPKSKCAGLTQNEKYTTPKLSAVNQISLPQLNTTKSSVPLPCTSALENARQTKPLCAKEVSKQLLSFFSPIQRTNSDSNAGVASRMKTPPKGNRTHSLQAELGNSKSESVTNYCNVGESPQPPQLPQQSDNQECLSTSNYFGFEEDETEDEFSPVKSYNRIPHQTVKFQCSTPKPVNLCEKTSMPFRFPGISAIKLQRHPQVMGKTPVSQTKHHRKNGNLNAYIKKESHIVRNIDAGKEKSVKPSCEPAIFDIEEQDLSHSKYDLDREFIPSVTVKDPEAGSSPNKRVVPRRSYTTPKPGTSRQSEHDKAEECVSEDESWENPAKKHKRAHRPPKKNEADEWAKSFNSMCENIESFELIVE